MSVKKAYHQGTEEPTPGKQQYQADPLNEEVRAKDKKTFDEADTGPVDGMNPGDLEKKKLLARAQSEQNALRRQAIVAAAKKGLVDKKAYFLGTEEPTPPGKAQYPVDPLDAKVREFDKPQADTLNEKEELALKQKLSRASLKARFVPASKAVDSTWHIFSDGKIVLSASVKDLCGDNADLMLRTVATREFGTDLIEKFKKSGAAGVKLFKKAQDQQVPPAPVAQELPPPAPMPAEQGMSVEPEVKDNGGDGDPRDTVVDLSEKIRDLSSDLAEAASKLEEEKVDMSTEPQGSSEKVAQLQSLRRELNDSLNTALTDTASSLNEHVDELQTIASILYKGSVQGSNKEFVDSVIGEAVEDAKQALASGFRLMTSFVKYARGSQNLVKRASMEDQLALESDTSSEITDEELSALLEDDDSTVKEDTMLGESSESLELVDENDLMAKSDELKNIHVTPGTKIEVTAATKEQRNLQRAKLASEMLSGEDLMQKAHPKGSWKLEVPSEGDLSLVEDVADTHEAMMDLVNAPVKVKKEAKVLHTLISEGKLEESMLDSLVAEGLDAEAVAYYKKYYSETDGGSEFASELVKEHAKAELDQEISKEKVKLARAFELTHEMVARGMCSNSRDAINAQVEELRGFDDHSFDSLKKVVARTSIKKEASLSNLPNIGASSAVDMHSGSQPLTLVEQLSTALNSNRRKNF